MTSTDPVLKRLLDTMEREHATTVRVLRAYPDDKLDLQPHPKCKPARELAWLLAMEQGFVEKALTTGFDWSAPPAAPPPAPETMAEIVAVMEAAHGRVMERLRTMSDDELRQTVQFFVAPKQLGDIPRMEFLWFLLHDQIHHRGQFSIYLRMAGAAVPSIYGPTADEPWT